MDNYTQTCANNGSSSVFIIHDKKLGFTLDKTKTTPTIEKITKNGALEKELIENCSTIISGCEIESIGGESIIGLNYEYALSKIKSFTERPIEIVIKHPNDKETKDTQPIIPQFTKSSMLHPKISVQEMDEISQKTTKQALKDLVQFELDKKNKEFSDSDEESLDEHEYISIEKYNKLENDIHLLRLEKTNIELCYNEELETIKQQLSNYTNINDALQNIQGLEEKLYYDYKSSSKESKCQLNRLIIEYKNNIKICDIYLDNINYGISYCIKEYINNKNKKITRYERITNIKIFIKYYFEWFQTISIILLAFTVYYIL